jgi:ribosomal protein S17
LIDRTAKNFFQEISEAWKEIQKKNQAMKEISIRELEHEVEAAYNKYLTDYKRAMALLIQNSKFSDGDFFKEHQTKRESCLKNYATVTSHCHVVKKEYYLKRLKEVCLIYFHKISIIVGNLFIRIQ